MTDENEELLAVAAQRVGRKAVPGLASPHPIGESLPAIYLADPFTQLLCDGLDDVLAPVLSTLDCLPAYLDPTTAPADALGWLASWLGVSLDAHLSQARSREVVAHGVERTGRRGTTAGLRDAVADAFENLADADDIEIIEPGGAQWSLTPGSPLPGEPDGELVVRLHVADPATVDQRRLDAVVGANKPAEIRHRVEVSPR